MPKNLEKSFRKDLDKLRAKYPMCYIEAWTPIDFACARTAEMNVEEIKPDWKNPINEQIVDGLENGFDANDGTYWERIKAVMRNLI